MQSDIKGRECESRLQSKSEREKDVINGAESKRLNENVTEKMCSSDGNVVGEMCSPADADTGVPYGKKPERTLDRTG